MNEYLLQYVYCVGHINMLTITNSSVLIIKVTPGALHFKSKITNCYLHSCRWGAPKEMCENYSKTCQIFVLCCMSNTRRQIFGAKIPACSFHLLLISILMYKLCLFSIKWQKTHDSVASQGNKHAFKYSGQTWPAGGIAPPFLYHYCQPNQTQSHMYRKQQNA